MMTNAMYHWMNEHWSIRLRLAVGAAVIMAVAAFGAWLMHQEYGVSWVVLGAMVGTAMIVGFVVSCFPRPVRDWLLVAPGMVLIVLFPIAQLIYERPMFAYAIVLFFTFWAGAMLDVFIHPEKGRRGHRRANGQAYVEFLIVLPLFLVIIAGVIGFGQALYTKLAMEAAAWSGARHATATLNRSRGYSQGVLGARYALYGFGLNPNSAEVDVDYWGGWGRGSNVRVESCYNVPSPPVPMGEVLAPSRVCSRQWMPIEPWQSRW
jgi:hypothetical protein